MLSIRLQDKITNIRHNSNIGKIYFISVFLSHLYPYSDYRLKLCKKCLATNISCLGPFKRRQAYSTPAWVGGAAVRPQSPYIQAPSIRSKKGQKWFFQISSKWESQKNRDLHWCLSAKSSFYLPAFEISIRVVLSEKWIDWSNRLWANTIAAHLILSLLEHHHVL